MFELSLYLAMLMMALASSVHCFAMCGPIVGVLSFGSGRGTKWTQVLGYNLGRLSSYTIAGILAGGMGQIFAERLVGVHLAQQALQMLASIMMMAVAIHISGFCAALAPIERIGGVLWKQLAPLTQRFLPIDSFGKAYGAGLVWGWLPCGLVYSALISAIGAGSAIKGGLMLLSFGVGTLPALLAMGLMGQQLTRLLRWSPMRLVSAGLLFIIGLLLMWRVVA